MTDILDYAKAIGSFCSELAAKFSFRLALWIITVFVSIYPPIHVSKVPFDFNPNDLAAQINASGSFKDLFFIVVIVSLVGILNIATDIYDRGKPSNFRSICYFILVPLFIINIVSGIDEFGLLSSYEVQHVPVPASEFNNDMKAIYVTCGLELFVEFLLAIVRR